MAVRSCSTLVTGSASRRQRAAGEVCADRPAGDLEPFGNLAVGQPADVVQHQDRVCPRAQPSRPGARRRGRQVAPRDLHLRVGYISAPGTAHPYHGLLDQAPGRHRVATERVSVGQQRLEVLGDKPVQVVSPHATVVYHNSGK